jgi:4-hydroxy-tetrahydrodipicolinate reductase
VLRVGIAGALGRLGRVACAAVDAAEDLAVAATYSRGDDLDGFIASGLDVVLDCTVYPVTVDIARAAIAAHVPIVIGATGWKPDDLQALASQCLEARTPALLVPNFSFGALLMMRFAAQAARVFPQAEIIELHHDAKRDAPSGTAQLTAQRIAEAGAPQPPIHSVRLPGLVAHQEVMFGGAGETLTIRHDSLAREAYGRGIVAAIRAVPAQRGLVMGLDSILDDVVGDACGSR